MSSTAVLWLIPHGVRERPSIRSDLIVDSQAERCAGLMQGTLLDAPSDRDDRLPLAVAESGIAAQPRTPGRHGRVDSRPSPLGIVCACGTVVHAGDRRIGHMLKGQQRVRRADLHPLALIAWVGAVSGDG